MKNRLYGIGLTLLLSGVVLIIFLGSLLWNLNSTYFSPAGDGFKAYYGAIYHVAFDSTANRTSSMHYPFGEMTAFTDSQPPVTNAIRWISHHLTDISGGVTGIINGLMLLSFILGALFLYLILLELKVSWWYAAVAAVGISMLSPQVARLGGHFSLSWQVWLPLMIWLLIRFHHSRKLLITLLIGLTVYLAGKMHLYFVGFFGFMIGGYWFWRFVRYKHTITYWYRDLLTFSIQYLLPVILLQLSIMLNDEVADRTAYPYGFYVFLGHPVAVFFPSGQPWGFVASRLTVFSHISWEAISYIGTAALAGIVVAVVLWIIRVVRKEASGRIIPSITVSVLFWVSVAALIFSFGVPFIFGLESWVDILGPVRQLRALGRFAWLFYYLVNLIVFALFYRLAFKEPGKLAWKIVALAALALLLFEGSWNMKGNTGKLKNQLPELTDKGNLLEENQWVSQVDPKAYQAIIPVPYFHVGSESIWIDSRHGAKEATMLVSLKTGLPTTGAELSRTSISQTYMNYALFTEPLQRLEVNDFIESEKPFLVLLMNGYEPTESESWLLKDAVRVAQNGKFSLWSLPVTAISSFHETWRRHIFEKYDTARLFPAGQLMVSDTSQFLRKESFDQLPAPSALRGQGAFTFPAREWRSLYEDTLRGVPAGNKVVLSFWVNKYQNDGYLRGNAEVIQKNISTGETTGYLYSDFFRHLKAYYDDWALLEIEIETKSSDEAVKLSVRNAVLPKAEYVIDELMIREKGVDVWERDEQGIIHNGRKFIKR